MVHVAAAVIIRDGRVLLARRPPGTHLAGAWEFPGGKVEAWESLAEGLHRELAEELGTGVAIRARWKVVRHRYPEKEVELHFFVCRLTGPEPSALHASEIAWVGARELGEYQLPPADEAVLAELPALLVAERSRPA
jgi:8-oxo-dGTP diphosphatase